MTMTVCDKDDSHSGTIVVTSRSISINRKIQWEHNTKPYTIRYEPKEISQRMDVAIYMGGILK